MNVLSLRFTDNRQIEQQMCQTTNTLRDFRLPQRCKQGLRSSGILRSVNRLFGKPVCLSFKVPWRCDR